VRLDRDQPEGLPAAAVAGPLGAQVANLQQHLEQDFEPAGSIIELVHESATSDQVVDLSETWDSAIWTGVYLASQCFRYESTLDPGERADAHAQILWALDSVDRLFNVTGTGLLTRFAFNSEDPYFRQLKFTQTATSDQGWAASPSMPGWIWMQGTSRDQYTGIFFGLGVCNQIMPDAQIHQRTADRIASTVEFLAQHGWKIPVPASSGIITSDKIPLEAQVAWLDLEALSQGHSLPAFATAMSEEKGDLLEWMEPSSYNNMMEYYGWNLGYLRYYTLLAFDSDRGDHKYLRRLFDVKVWDETWSHENSMFTFMKLGAIGRESSRDDTALEQAKESLWELAFKNRRDFKVVNSTRKDVPRDLGIATLGWFCRILGLSHIHFVQKLDTDQARRPLPMKDRPPSDFMWQRSPFTLDGGGDGTIESPSIDTILAYWLGRYHGLVSEKD